MHNRKKTKVIAIGSALVDILIHEDDAFVTRTGASKGGMTYVDDTKIEKVLTETSTPPRIVPGGSACNTAVGIGQLGGEAHFFGKCGRDNFADLLEESLTRQHVRPHLIQSSATPTGRVLSIITPDAERSMLTFLGASAEMTPDDLPHDLFNDMAVVHVEGYLLFNRNLLTAVLDQAKTAGAKVSLDLASYTVVEAAIDVLPDLIKKYVDILIANEDEALAYTGLKNETASLAAMAGQVELAVLKTGPRGSLIARGDEIVTIQPKGDGSAVDTTGAGDLWAAGFLYGVVQGMPLDLCGDLGSLCGYEVCQVDGANIPEDRWMTIRSYMEEKWQKRK